MANCKLCNKSISSGIVLHKECYDKLIRENEELRANSMIQSKIIEENSNPLDKDKIVKLIMEKETLRQENKKLKKGLKKKPFSPTWSRLK